MFIVSELLPLLLHECVTIVASLDDRLERFRAFKTSRFTISHTFDSMLVPKDGVVKPKSMNICDTYRREATTARFLAYKEGDDGVLNQKYYCHTDC